MMQPLLTLAFVVFAVVAGLALADDDCAPPKRGEKPVHPGECCKFSSLIPSSMMTTMDKCKQKYPIGHGRPRPSGPPTGPPPTPSAEMKLAFACNEECVFSEEGLLTADKTLDKAAITKYFTSTTDTSTTPVMTANFNKCFGSYEADVDSSLECKSGALELKKCMLKETFLNCPGSLWTASTECDALKAMVGKCPMIPVFM